MDADNEIKLLKQKIQQSEVACAELMSLPRIRPVYQKRGNLFFKSDVQKVLSTEQKELDKAKGKLRLSLKQNPSSLVN